MRDLVLAEEPLCRWCVERDTVTKDSLSTICDHIVPLTEGGTDDRDNLAGMCEPCHDQKTAEEAARAQGRAAPTVRRCQPVGADGWPTG
ncbi:HNH endonuclease signature motif containing protein [Sphingomonas sp. RT2P30]|uniref:HNH endonuclease signature motif containing protein n=1 Tax=Parasphingomonas halimpatiens TaxID=3096162 RepID=UPI002FC92304